MPSGLASWRVTFASPRGSRTSVAVGDGRILDDTRSDAFWGLMLAGRAFQPGRGSFTAYAVVRIEGAIRRGRQIRSGLSRTLWEQGNHPTPLSLNAPATEEGDTELLDLLPAPSDGEHDWLPDATPTAARARSLGPETPLLPRPLASGL